MIKAAEPPTNSGRLKPPQPFEVVKELNTQAGRLATAYGLLLAATTFSLGNSPIKDGLAPLGQPLVFEGWTWHGVAVVAIPAIMLLAFVVAGACIVVGFQEVLRAFEPSLPVDREDATHWQALIARKQTSCYLAAKLLQRTIRALLVAWSFGQFPALLTIQTANPTGDLRPLLFGWAVGFFSFVYARNWHGDPFWPQIPWPRKQRRSDPDE